MIKQQKITHKNSVFFNATECAITVPTLLTLLRIAITPVIMVMIKKEWWFSAIIFFCVGAATDFFDGFIARMTNQVTLLGTVLDPIADKIFTLGIMVMFVQEKDIYFILVVVLFIKEILLLSGILLLYLMRKKWYVFPNFLGKWAMALQLLFLLFFFVCKITAISCSSALITLLLSIVVVCHLVAFCYYAFLGWRALYY